MRPGLSRLTRLSWRHDSWRHELVRSIARVIGLLYAGYEQGRRRAVKLRARLICFTPKLGEPFGRPARFVTPKDRLKKWTLSIRERKKPGEICARLTNSINVCGRGSTPPMPP
jgi:hypothetical protein